ncbi:toprim domain-containing protein [Streptomyces syringium]|uniref:toprim domain-containing protein n=1 Tax=Streptomyces syringium TaxID=76729 RepID=UPI003D91E2B1
MSKRSDSQKAVLLEAAKRNHQSYRGSPAETYMNHRGLGEAADRFKIGYVSDPVPGHDRYRGRLAIPYLRPAGGLDAVATIRFRCIADACTKAPDGSWLEEEQHPGHGKYLGLPGDPPMLFNTLALIRPSPHIVLGEGELDPVASELAGVPATGLPGVTTWQDHFAPAFAGFEVVFVIGDGDPAGRKFTNDMCEILPNAQPIDLGDGYDINTFVNEKGAEKYRQKLGVQ